MMKKTIAIACVVAPILMGNLAVTAIAAPLPTSNLGREYYVSAPDLKQWSGGLYVDSMERKLAPVGMSSSDKVKYSRDMGYIGYDFIPWITSYLTVGVGSVKIGQNAKNSNSGVQAGLGVHFNLMDKDILDPTLYEDKIRVTAGLQYIAAKPEFDPNGNGVGKKKIKFDELSGSIIVSLVNDVEGSKLFSPFGLSIFGGLLYSDLMTDAHNVDEDAKIGLTAGLEIFYTETVSFYLAVDRFDDMGSTAGVNVRF
jgi:hypothetical protein